VRHNAVKMELFLREKQVHVAAIWVSGFLNVSLPLMLAIQKLRFRYAGMNTPLLF
jgi:hypothetical protein